MTSDLHGVVGFPTASVNCHASTDDTAPRIVATMRMSGQRSP
jgi:hypothetical protein